MLNYCCCCHFYQFLFVFLVLEILSFYVSHARSCPASFPSYTFFSFKIKFIRYRNLFYYQFIVDFSGNDPRHFFPSANENKYWDVHGEMAMISKHFVVHVPRCRFHLYQYQTLAELCHCIALHCYNWIVFHALQWYGMCSRCHGIVSA